MKTLNSKAGSFISAAPPIISCDDDRQPCWYADMERGKSRNDYKWKVGRKHDGKTDEYRFGICDVGDVDDDDFWSRATGVDFATELIDLFRKGGQKAVKKWVKSGCP